jgi:Cu+-exporting ATPase
MTRDPVCGMNVADNSPYKSRYAGHDYAFCSDACRADFDRAPAAYATSEGVGSSLSADDNR